MCARRSVGAWPVNRALLNAAAIACALAARPSDCQSLLVAPSRVVIEGTARTAAVNLTNTGARPVAYRIALVQCRMNEVGDIVPARSVQPGELFATGLLRVSPSRVTLSPGAHQVVRLQARLPVDLAPGEYRSHLEFARIADLATEVDATSLPAEALGIALRPVYGFSIPVIVRRGTLSAAVELSDIRFCPATNSTPAQVSFHIHRAGTMSTYGDVVVSLHARDGGTRVVGRANGVAVYYPNTVRRAIMSLDIPLGAQIEGARLSISYLKQDDPAASPWARESVDLGP